MNRALFIETQRERAQSCGYKPRRGVSLAGLPPPAKMRKQGQDNDDSILKKYKARPSQAQSHQQYNISDNTGSKSIEYYTNILQ